MPLPLLMATPIALLCLRVTASDKPPIRPPPLARRRLLDQVPTPLGHGVVLPPRRLAKVRTVPVLIADGKAAAGAIGRPATMPHMPSPLMRNDTK